MPQRIDDPDLKDEDLLWRRIPDNQQSISRKGLADGEVRPSSAAFIDNYTGEPSVFVVSLKTQESVLEGYPDMGLVTIEAKVPRNLQYIIGLTPEVEDPAHRVIVPGPTHPGNSRKSDARLMAKAAKWIILPRSCRKVAA